MTPLSALTARNRRAEAAEAMRAHAKLCRECQSFTQTASAYCPDGYELAKEYRAASAAELGHGQDAEAEQGELF